MPKKINLKLSYNTFGLFNQWNSETRDLNDSWDSHLCFDSLKTGIQAEEESEDEMEELDMENGAVNEMMSSSCIPSLQVKMVDQAKFLEMTPEMTTGLPGEKKTGTERSVI